LLPIESIQTVIPIHNVTTMAVDVLRLFIQWSLKEEAHKDVVCCIARDSLFIAALTAHLSDQPRDGTCEENILTVAFYMAKWVDSNTVKILFRAKFFATVVKFLFIKKLHLIVLALKIILAFILTRKGNRIIRNLCSTGVPLFSGLMHLLQLHAENVLDTYIVCRHYPWHPEAKSPVSDLVLLLYEVSATRSVKVGVKWRNFNMVFVLVERV